MFKNYILISFRNLRKNLSYSVINVLGLALGLATCLLIVIWILHELSYDKFNKKADRIYRVSLEYSFGGTVSAVSVSPTALLPALTSLPETETGVRVYNPSVNTPYVIRKDEKHFQEDRFYFADSTFFNVFTYKLLKGNAREALVNPYSVILTQSTAKKYFGAEDAMNKILRINETQDYRVTGIIENAPDNSLLQFDFIASFSSLKAGREKPIWWSANYQTFVVLYRGADLSALRTKTNEIAMKAVASDLAAKNDYVRYNFMPLTDVYLHSEYNTEPEIVSDIKYVYIFSAVALLILVIACINYVNLATARAVDRAKEVGIRKVSGALRSQLFIQFIGESATITFFSFGVAYGLAQALLPVFNTLTGKNFTFTLLLQPSFLGITIIALVIIALISGSYPALAITSFSPVHVLKGSFKTSAKGVWLRRSLVIFQFAISITLIVGTIVITRQLKFIQEKDLGYDRENTIVLPCDLQTEEVFETFKTELMKDGSALQVGRGSESPVNIKGGYGINANNNADPGIITTGLRADEGYLPAINVKLLLGRNFERHDRERLSKDTVFTFILNESALEALYLNAEQALGKNIFIGPRKGEIIGIVKNFHFTSLHHNIGPLVVFPQQDGFNKIFIKLPAGDIASHLDKVKRTYASIITHRPFEFEFMDQQYAALYNNENRLNSVFIVFATLAIIIACLGLLGLVSFYANQKTKEIGIRKTLGATVKDIVVLITKDFMRLVVIAILIGIPLAYWIMLQWLEGFAYKTNIGIQPLLIASCICITIALSTAGYQAIKAAFTDPSRTLRNE